MAKNLLFSIITLIIILSGLEFLFITIYLISPKVNLPNAISHLTSNYYYQKGRRLDQYFCGQFDSNLFYKYKPGNCEVTNLEFNTKLSINSFGARDSEESLSSDLDIVFLGDSHTSGWGMLPSERFSDIIAKEKKLNTLNIGVSSYGTVRELKNLEQLDKINSSYNYVVIQYESNDIGENKSFFENNNKLVISESNTFNKTQAHNLEKTKYIFGNGILFILNTAKENLKIFLHNKFDIKFEHMPLSQPVVKETEEDRKLEIFYFINALKQKSHLLKNKKVILFGISIQSNWDQLVWEELKENKIDFVKAVLNPTNFLSNEDYFKIDRHINKSGHQKIAAELMKHIIQ